jgi:hypothetical protein
MTERRLPPPNHAGFDPDPILTQSEFETLARRLSPEALATVFKVLRDPNAKAADKLRASEIILTNGYGRTSTRTPSDLDAGLDGRRSIKGGMSGMLDAIESELAAKNMADAAAQASPQPQPESAEPGRPKRDPWRPLIVGPPPQIGAPRK